MALDVNQIAKRISQARQGQTRRPEPNQAPATQTPQGAGQALQRFQPAFQAQPSPEQAQAQPTAADEALAGALIAAAPTLIGAATGGLQGAGIGAQAGGAGAKQFFGAREAERQRQREQEQLEAKQQLQERKLGLAERRVGTQEDLVEIKRQQALANATQTLNKLKREKIDKKVKSEDSLRKERNRLPITKDTQIMTSAFKKINEIASGEKTPAGDISLVINYMKMLDPESTVREGEFATVRNATGVPPRIRNAYNRMVLGDQIPQELVEDIQTRTDDLYKSQLEAQAAVDSQFINLAKKRNIDPRNVIFQFIDPSEMPAGVLKTYQQAGLDIDVDKKRLQRQELEAAAQNIPQNIRRPKVGGGPPGATAQQPSQELDFLQKDIDEMSEEELIKANQQLNQLGLGGQ